MILWLVRFVIFSLYFKIIFTKQSIMSTRGEAKVQNRLIRSEVFVQLVEPYLMLPYTGMSKAGVSVSKILHPSRSKETLI